MTNIKDVIDTLWEIINIDFVTGIGTFSLFDVMCAGALLSLIGLFIGNVVLFAKNRR